MSRLKFAVVGHPIGHTMSPFIHNRLFELSGIEADYTALDIAPENFEREYRETLSNLCGYNLTIPHKQRVIPLLSQLDEKAKLYGSVNTVSNLGSEPKGFTTDPDGFVAALALSDIPLAGRVVVAGCGGVARTMAFEALFAGAELELAVRSQSIPKAESLKSELENHFGKGRVKVCALSELDGKIDLFVNGTPVGMIPNSDSQPIGDAQLKNCANVYDAVYNPLNTVLVRKARANGSKAEGGMSMLVLQAAKAQEHWFNSKFDPDEIKRLCRDAAEELMKR